MKPSLPARIVAYSFLGIICAAGPVMLLIAAGTGIERALFIRSSLTADGVIVGLTPVRPRRPADQSRFPVFRFNREQRHELHRHIQNRPTPVSLAFWRSPADTVPAWPFGKRYIDSFLQLWMPQVIIGIVGGGFSVIPLLILLRRRRSST